MAKIAPATPAPKYESIAISLEHSFAMDQEIRSKVDGMRVLGWTCLGVISSIKSNTVYLVFEREVKNG